MKYATRETNATRAVIHSGAAVATLLQRNQKKTISIVEPQKMETTNLSSVSKYDIITVMSARYARRWRRAARAATSGGSQVSEHAEQKPLSLPWNVAQLLHGYGAAAANSSSSRAPELCGGGLQRPSTAAAGASTAGLSMMLCTAAARRGQWQPSAPETVSCSLRAAPAGSDAKARPRAAPPLSIGCQKQRVREENIEGSADPGTRDFEYTSQKAPGAPESWAGPGSRD